MNPWLLALLSGSLVVAVTMAADRMGPRIGGMLGTLPVTSLVGLGYLFAHLHTPAESHYALLGGMFALIGTSGAVTALVLIAQSARLSCGPAMRIAWALGGFVLAYVGVTTLALRLLPVGAYLLGLAPLLLLLTQRFLARHLPAAKPRPMPLRRSFREFCFRFAIGAIIIPIIRWGSTRSLAIAGALSIFPGLFLVSLSVMAVRQNLVFATRAAYYGLAGVWGAYGMQCTLLTIAPTFVPYTSVTIALLLALGAAMHLIGLWAADRIRRHCVRS